jgi:hypothetical protein
LAYFLAELQIDSYHGFLVSFISRVSVPVQSDNVAMMHWNRILWSCIDVWVWTSEAWIREKNNSFGSFS